MRLWQLGAFLLLLALVVDFAFVVGKARLLTKWIRN